MSNDYGFETLAGTSTAPTDGQTATSANVGGTVTNGAQTFSAAAKYEGSFGLRIQTTASGTNTISRFSFPSATAQASACVALQLEAVPASGSVQTIWTLRYASGAAFRLMWDGSLGGMAVRGTGTTATQVAIPGTYNAAWQYVVTARVTPGAVGTGRAIVNVYNAATRRLIGTLNDTTLSYQTANITAADIGMPDSAAPSGRAHRYDSLRLESNTTAEILPASWSRGNVKVNTASGWITRPLRVYDTATSQWVVKPAKIFDTTLNQWRTTNT